MVAPLLVEDLFGVRLRRRFCIEGHRWDRRWQQARWLCPVPVRLGTKVNGHLALVKDEWFSPGWARACPGSPRWRFRGTLLSAFHYWWRSQIPKFWPPLDSTEGLITTAPEELASMVSIISVVAQGPRMVPLPPL
jgi:hypothetical protein